MKKLNVAMLLVLSSVALAACGGGSNSSEPSVNSSVEEESSTVVTSDSSVVEESSEDVSSEEESSSPKSQEDMANDFAAKVEVANGTDAQNAWNLANFNYGNQWSTTTCTFAKFFDANGAIAVLHSQSYSNDTTYYYHTAEGEAHAYKVNDDTEKVSKDSDPDEKIFKGPSLTYSNIFNPDYSPVFGAEEAAAILAPVMQANKNRDLDIHEDGDKYEFSFGYATESEWKSYYIVSGTVEFKAGSFIKAMSLEVSNLMAGDIIVDDEFGTFTLVDGAVLNPSSFEYEASEGAPIEHTLPYQESDFLFTAFTLGDEDMEPISDGAVVDATISNGFVIINLVSSEPASASADFDPFNVTVVDADGNSQSYPYAYNSYSNYFQFQVSGPGMYNVTIATKNVSHTFAVNAKAPAPRGFNFYNVQFTEYGSSDMQLPSTFYIGNTYNIKAAVDPFDAPKGYTLSIQFAGGREYPDEAICKQGTNWDGSPFDYYEFTPSVAGDIIITATSTEDTSVSSVFTATVGNVPSFDTVFHDTLVNVNMRGGYIVWYLDFDLNADTDACDGTVTISNQNRAASASYSFSFEGYEAQLVKIEGDDLGFESATLSVDANLQPYFNIDRGNDWVENLNLQVFESRMEDM